MLSKKLLKLYGIALTVMLCMGPDAATTENLKTVAGRVIESFDNVAKLISAAAYVAGMGFAVGAIAKFKQHKENPTQIPLSQPVVFLLVGVCLMFAPSIFSVGGATLFGSSATKGGVGGISSF